jgi:hypothetical protein
MNELISSLDAPQYRYLAVGEIIRKGDEVLGHSPCGGYCWIPVQATIGQPVRIDTCGDFRRPVK